MDTQTTKIHTPEIGLQRKGPSFQIIISDSCRTKDGELIIQAQKKAIKVQNPLLTLAAKIGRISNSFLSY